MVKKFFQVIVWLLILSFQLPAFAGGASPVVSGDNFFNAGVFAYESGDYDTALERFRQAISIEKGNPFYNYYMGKAYMAKGEYDKAIIYLDQARISGQKIPGLSFDWAMVHYRMGDYAASSRLFAALSEDEPNNALARYYAGISFYRQGEYEKALSCLQEAGRMNSSLKPNASYYEALCYLKTGDREKAKTGFSYAKRNATERQTRDAADRQLKALARLDRRARRYSLAASVGVQYDSNVLLEPVNNEDLYSNEDDFKFTALLSGSYDVARVSGTTFGLGYSHYQSWYTDLHDYDLIGSMFDFYIRHQSGNYMFSFAYKPAYFWIDSDSYLMRHEFRPKITAKFGDRLITSLAYSYKRDNSMYDDGRDGHVNEADLRLMYAMPGGMGELFGNMLYDVVSASSKDDDYHILKTALSARFYLPRRFSVTVKAGCWSRDYDNVDSTYNLGRHDTKYIGGFFVGKELYRDQLSIEAGYTYTKNDSNIPDYRYESNAYTVNLKARL